MLDYLRYCLDRLRHPRERADAVLKVRLRLAAQPGTEEVDPSERVLATRLVELRVALAAAFRDVRCCRQCSRPVSTEWPGGQCCGGHAEHLFTDDELAALKLSGTTASRLRPPNAPHEGCAFRAPTGCALDPAHRPVMCLRYACAALERELRARSDFAEITALRTEALVAFQAFVNARARRVERDGLERLERATRVEPGTRAERGTRVEDVEPGTRAERRARPRSPQPPLAPSESHVVPAPRRGTAGG